MKFKFIKVLHNEVGDDLQGDIPNNSNKYFHFDKNVLDEDYFTPKWNRHTLHGKIYYDMYLTVYNYNTKQDHLELYYTETLCILIIFRFKSFT